MKIYKENSAVVHGKIIKTLTYNSENIQHKLLLKDVDRCSISNNFCLSHVGHQ